MHDLWAMLENELQTFLENILNATAEQREKAQSLFASAKQAPVMTVSNGVATIAIAGILRREPATPLMQFFGIQVTGYADIVAAAERAKGDDSIKSVILRICSPGGAVDGLDECYQHLASLGQVKPLSAEVCGLCASGAYWLACAAEGISSSAPSNPVGSIGVLAAFRSWKKCDERLGVNEIVIVSKNAPKKYSDPESQTGRDTIQDHLDAVERIFHSRVATGRRVTVDHVRERFGQGAVFVSMDPDPAKPDALKAGMIDAVINSITSNSKGISTMQRATNEQLKSAATVLAGPFPEQLKTLAGKVLTGEADAAALEIAIVAFSSYEGKDAGQKEKDAAAVVAASAAFTEEVNAARAKAGLPPLPTATIETVRGVASTENQFQTMIAAEKKRCGLKE